jgi:protein-S-isoprenylcysteine O-methyltransferase Ste14
MTVELPDAIVIGAYVAMGLELAFLSVPSAVSTRALLRRPEVATVFARVATVLPIALILLLFAVPPVVALRPAVLDHLLPIPQLATPAVRWTGVALLLCGKLLPPLSLPALRRALDQGLLARSGPFAYSRHPGLVGLFAFYLGAALIYPCAVLFAGFPLYAWHMHRRALMEEVLLRERFPDDYDDYARRVPRYLGVPR